MNSEMGTVDSAGKETLEWVSFPMRERPKATVALVAIMLVSSFAASVMMGNIWWGIIGLALLFLSMWNFFLPVEFIMDSAGVRKKSPFGTEVKKWEEVRSIIPDANGVLLSPFKEPTRLAKFRGLSVQYSGNREEVLEFIRARIKS
ncbi:MAG: hypothetical protein B1H09_06535 [Gemmatimonadaceae bacterium 4484_173]|nr:MAG: hypothetical protein B1H09_06535 [Gemmatimonadaceae bacterium 4484_173]RKZ05067.1 MAG: hypothetical protein DRQ21_00925 [Candidatus Fermentibacteria bacterium]